jgi:hypothetical protein
MGRCVVHMNVASFLQSGNKTEAHLSQCHVRSWGKLEGVLSLLLFAHTVCSHAACMAAEHDPAPLLAAPVPLAGNKTHLGG